MLNLKNLFISLLLVLSSIVTVVVADNDTGVLTEKPEEKNEEKKCSPESSISNLNEYRHCEVINGNLMIENYDSPIIQLDNLKRIEGDFIILKSPKLVRIEIPNLSEISNELKIHQLTSLSLISFPQLKSVKSLNWKVLPILSNIRFSNEISNVENIRISDTSLIGFTGFQAETLKNLDINNNRFLEVINSNVEQIQGKLHIVSNAKNLKLELPLLTSVNNISINDVSDLNLQNLTEINESFSLVNNRISNLKLPSLHKIGGTFNLLKNHELQSIDLNKLSEINGGLMLINNTRIKDVSFLKNLQIIDGGLEINGDFKAIDFSNLKLLKGSAKIKSSNNNLDCNKIIRDQFNLSLRGGKVTCESGIRGMDRNGDDGSSILEQKSLAFKISTSLLAILALGLLFHHY